MAEPASPVDPASTSTPPEQSAQPTGRENTTANTKDKPQLALARLFKRAEELETQHRGLKADLDAKTKDLKALGVTPGEAVSAEKLPINQESIEKALTALKGGKLKVKDFQRAMGFFDTQELSRVRKALVAAGVTVETGEGSVVFIELTPEFIPGNTK